MFIALKGPCSGGHVTNSWSLHRSLPGVPEAELTELQKAARYGDEGERDCQYEFPCLVQPLDLLLYMYEYWFGDDSA